MAPLEVYSFQDVTTRFHLYQGPFHRLRPLVKWVVAVYLLVAVVLSALVLHEQSLGNAFISAIPALVCLGWLYATKPQKEFVRIPITITFYPDGFTLDRPDSLSGGSKQEIHIREFYQMPYREVTKIRYDQSYKRVSIHGRGTASFYHRHGERIEDTPYLTKEREGAAAYWTDGLSPEEDERLLDTLTKYTGKQVERYGSTSS